MTQAVTISLYIVHSLSEIRCLSRDLECVAALSRSVLELDSQGCDSQLTYTLA